MPYPSPLRILAAALYDAVILLVILFVAAIPFPLLFGAGFELNPMTRVAFQFYLLAVAYAWFAWHWRQGYPTPGQKIWQLCLIGAQGRTLSWPEINLRFGSALLSLALLGGGWLWAFFRGQTLHDQLAGTTIVACSDKEG